MNEEQVRTIIREEMNNILGRYDRIPFNIESALRERLLADEVKLDTTGKSLTSEQHAGGAAGLKNPEFWLTVTINNTKYFLAAYT